MGFDFLWLVRTDAMGAGAVGEPPSGRPRERMARVSVRHIVEQHIQARIGMLGVILSRLQACLRHGLGLIDPNLTTFRLVPPESAHA
jgi:hypothetical protein